jgi:hypothetical protein
MQVLWNASNIRCIKHIKWAHKKKRLFLSFLKSACSLYAYLRGGADKSLVRPGRKQGTATKLGIYSIYSHPPRSWTHFLARSSNFCKPLKKNNLQKFFRPIRFPRHKWPPRRTKNGFNLTVFFKSRKQVVARQGQIRRIGWVIKTLEAQVGQYLVGCKCPVSRSIVVQEQDAFGLFWLFNKDFTLFRSRLHQL